MLKYQYIIEVELFHVARSKYNRSWAIACCKINISSDIRYWVLEDQYIIDIELFHLGENWSDGARLCLWKKAALCRGNSAIPRNNSIICEICSSTNMSCRIAIRNEYTMRVRADCHAQESNKDLTSYTIVNREFYQFVLVWFRWRYHRSWAIPFCRISVI